MKNQIILKTLFIILISYTDILNVCQTNEYSAWLYVITSIVFILHTMWYAIYWFDRFFSIYNTHCIVFCTFYTYSLRCVWCTMYIHVLTASMCIISINMRVVLISQYDPYIWYTWFIILWMCLADCYFCIEKFCYASINHS